MCIVGWLVLLSLVGCDDSPDASKPAPKSKAASKAKAAPTKQPSDDDEWCLSPDGVENMGSVVKAPAPLSDCSKNLKIHCIDDGETLCGYPLDVAKTQALRKKRPKVCCYLVK